MHILVDGAVMVVGNSEGVSGASDDSSEVIRVTGDGDVSVVLLTGSAPMVESDVGRGEVTGAEVVDVFTPSGPRVDFSVSAEVASGVGRRSTVGVEAEVVVGILSVVVVVVNSGRATVDVKVTTGLEEVIVVFVVGASSVLVVSSVVTALTVV